MGYTPSNSFLLKNLEPGKNYRVEIKTVWEDGKVSEANWTELNLNDFLPEEIYLSEVNPINETSGWRNVERDRAVSGGPISINGKLFKKGIGTHSISEIEYDLKGLFCCFSAKVGVDDGSRSDKGSVEFIVYGDGKELWRSGVMRKSDGVKGVFLEIKGVKRLLLKVNDGGDGIDYDHADWADAKVRR